MIDTIEFRARRVVLKLTQKQLALMLDISREHLCRLESGKLRVSSKLERRYNELFGTRRLISFRTERGVDCLRCANFNLERLNEPENPLNTIWRCKDCGLYFTTREAWHIE